MGDGRPPAYLKDKMRKLEFYLAHPFNERHNIRTWELGFEKRTHINLINPFYDISREDVERIDAGRAERYTELIPKELVERDIGYIIRSTTTGTIAFVTGALSYGTIMEMVYTKLNNKLLYSIVTNGHDNHPWLRYHSTKIFTNKLDFEKYIKQKS